jgi:hypothetical protein
VGRRQWPGAQLLVVADSSRHQAVDSGWRRCQCPLGSGGVEPARRAADGGGLLGDGWLNGADGRAGSSGTARMEAVVDTSFTLE